MIDGTARIHPTADLEAGVVVGPRTSVWHRAQIRAGARIGAECVIGRDAFIDEGVAIGDRVKIQNAALVYHGVTVEDGVFIGPNAILTNDRFPRAVTATGELARADDWVVSPITLRTGCSIGAGAVVVAGTVVGRFATVGAGSVVTRDVPDQAWWPATRPAASGGSAAAASAWRIPPVPASGGTTTDPPPAPPAGSGSRSPGTPAWPAPGRIRDDPDLQAGHRPGRGGGRARGPPLRHARDGEEDGRVRGGLGGLLRREHAILMSNGTVAQEAVLQGLGIGPGDEVITVSFSFNATVSVILRVGARPVFVDIRADDFCMDPAQVEAAITPRTKAIMPVHHSTG